MNKYCILAIMASVMCSGTHAVYIDGKGNTADKISSRYTFNETPEGTMTPSKNHGVGTKTEYIESSCPCSNPLEIGCDCVYFNRNTLVSV